MRRVTRLLAMANTSKYSTTLTARTCDEACRQRAENLAVIGVSSVIELCVGPSLRKLEEEYHRVGIKTVWGNDIDPRWRDYYPGGNWLIGDCQTGSFSDFEAVVIAPPLSKGCSGKREDSLRVDQVTPSYYDFVKLDNPVLVFVLPGRSMSTYNDLDQLYKFMKYVARTRRTEIVPLISKVAKYIDIYSVKHS